MAQNVVEMVKNNEALPYIMVSEEKTSEVAYPSLEAKLKELYTLKNRLEKYSKRLILEGLKYASENKLFVQTRPISEEYVDASGIKELAKYNFPSLYRRYNYLQEKYFQRLKTLKSLIQDS